MNETLINEMDWRVRVFDSLSFPTLIIKPDKSILTANKVFLERFNENIDQIVGKKCHEIFYGEATCPDSACPLKKVLSEKKGQSILRQSHSMTGAGIWEDRVFSPILDEEGNVDYIMESVRDVTQFKALESTLKETEAFLEKVILGSPIAVVVVNRSGDIMLMNPAAEDLFGYEQSDAVVNITFEDLYEPGVAEKIMRRLRAKRSNGQGKLLSTNTTTISASGEKIPVELNASIIYEKDAEVATVIIFKDLRQLIAMEKNLKESRAQMVQAEKMVSLGKLAAGVAHEINNPLTGILLYANMVLDSLDEGDTRRKELQYVLEDVNRCSEIVKNLLDYSRQTNPQKNVFSINTLVEEGLSLIRDQKLFLNIKLIKDLSSGDHYIQADKNQLAQVIINLVVNAIDAMEERGALLLRTYLDETSGQVCLEVSDTGRGIPEEDIQKIFDPFFTTKSPGKGTGLGLSTAYGIVKENRGEISIKKTTEEGTTFLLQFPEHGNTC
ncbi:MAG: PAS domain-containing protein [Deltaproteobacteria bacterium]|nr:PAS domain-containing protein [Deltaproteobacteria bacterium]